MKGGNATLINSIVLKYSDEHFKWNEVVNVVDSGNIKEFTNHKMWSNFLIENLPHNLPSLNDVKVSVPVMLDHWSKMIYITSTRSRLDLEEVHFLKSDNENYWIFFSVKDSKEFNTLKKWITGIFTKSEIREDEGLLEMGVFHRAGDSGFQFNFTVKEVF